MEDARFATLATSTPKKEGPWKCIRGGEEDTVSDKDRPTEIDPPEITQTPRNYATHETTNPEGGGEEDERFHPSTGGETIPSFRNCIGKELDDDVDLERSLSELVSEADKTDDDEADPKTKTPRRIYTHPTHQPRQGRRRRKPQKGKCQTHQPRKISCPRQRRKTSTTCIIIDLRMPSREHSSIRARSRRPRRPPRTIEVQISPAVSENKSEKKAPGEEDTPDNAMAKANRSRSASPKTKKWNKIRNE